MVNQSTPTEALDNKVLIITSAVVLDGNFDDSLLNQDKFVSDDILLADQATLLISQPLHVVNDLLLSGERERVEVVNLIHLDHQPRRLIVLVLVNLVLEFSRERVERLG